jgi:hypothetical protein
MRNQDILEKFLIKTIGGSHQYYKNIAFRNKALILTVNDVMLLLKC